MSVLQLYICVGGVGAGAGPPHAAEFEQSEQSQLAGSVHVAVALVQPEEMSPGAKQPGAGLPFQHHCMLPCATHAAHVVAGGGVGGGVGTQLVLHSASDCVPAMSAAHLPVVLSQE
jgi:hypothetical protein